MNEQQFDEKFRQLTLKFERIQAEIVSTRLRVGDVDFKVGRLVDELTLPSGKVSERFSKLEEQIRQLGDKTNKPAASKSRR